MFAPWRSTRDAGYPLCGDEWRRRVQEHGRRRELERSQHRPERYQGYALAIDPGTPAILYAGTGSGVFKSTNGGGEWSAFSTGLTNISVYALAIDSETPTILNAGTLGRGAFAIRQMEWKYRGYLPLIPRWPRGPRSHPESVIVGRPRPACWPWRFRAEGGNKNPRGLIMDMEHERQHPRSHLFTLRLWEETLGEGEAELRGRVQALASGETVFFRDWPGLVTTLTRLISKSTATAEEGAVRDAAHG